MLVAALLGVMLSNGPRTAACEPRTLDAWRQRCLTSRDGLEQALTEARRTRCFATLGSATDACGVMAGLDGVAGARAQLLAVMLNVCTGRLKPECCVDRGDEGPLPLAELIRRADRALSAPDCDPVLAARIGRALAMVNDGSALGTCGT